MLKKNFWTLNSNQPGRNEEVLSVLKGLKFNSETIHKYIYLDRNTDREQIVTLREKWGNSFRHRAVSGRY